MPRVFVGGLFHEANAFSPIKTPLEAFDIAPAPLSGSDEASGAWVGYSSFLRAAKASGAKVVAGFYAMATPSAPCSAKTYQALKDRLIASLKQAMPVDAVCLFLHGAQTAQGEPDCAGDIALMIRQMVGPHVPIGVALDLHANIHPRLLKAATFVQACKEYPHTDFEETAQHVWDKLIGQAQPITPIWQPVPIFPTSTTVDGPLRAFVDNLKEIEAKAGTSISALHGIPHADVAHGQAGILSYGLSQEDVTKLALQFFNAAHQAAKNAPGLSVERTLRQAEKGPRPVVIAERSDNPGAGGAGDATQLLSALIGAFPDLSIGAALFHDPALTQKAHEAGEGAVMPAQLGGRANALSGDPLELDVTIRALRNDEAQPYFGLDGAIALGQSALLQAGRTFIIVNTVRQQPFSPVVFTAHGLDPASLDILLVKSTNHFYGAFVPLAKTILYCDAMGAASEDLTAFPYKNLRRPVWPLDPLAACFGQLKSEYL